MPIRVFLNYRRTDDPGHAGWLYERLKAVLPEGDLFMDIDGSSIPLGADFSCIIDAQVANCDVLLAVIGPHWLSRLRERATESQDFVVLEIESALRQQKLVVPVLVGDTPMPRAEQLPARIRDLAYRNGQNLPNAHFRVLVEDFIQRLVKH